MKPEEEKNEVGSLVMASLGDVFNVCLELYPVEVNSFRVLLASESKMSESASSDAYEIYKKEGSRFWDVSLCSPAVTMFEFYGDYCYSATLWRRSSSWFFIRSANYFYRIGYKMLAFFKGFSTTIFFLLLFSAFTWKFKLRSLRFSFCSLGV